MQKNIYVLMDQNGRVSNDTLSLIRKTLNNDLAKKNVDRALRCAKMELDKANIYILGFGNVDMYCIRSWEWSARNARLKVPFVNQDIHDLDDYMKLRALTDFE
jgi:hypothetical protein